MQTIGDIIKQREPFWVDANDSVRRVVEHLCARGIGAVAVKEQDEVVGVFSERDLMQRVVVPGLDPEQVPVRDVMSTSLTFIGLDDSVRTAKALMHESRKRHLLVVGKDCSFRGMVSMREMVEADVADYAEAVAKMNDKYYESAYRARWRTSSNRVIVEHLAPQD